MLFHSATEEPQKSLLGMQDNAFAVKEEEEEGALTVCYEEEKTLSGIDSHSIEEESSSVSPIKSTKKESKQTLKQRKR